MWPLRRRVLLRALATTLCVAAVVWLVLWYFIPSPPSSITIAAGIKGGNFERIAYEYREKLARHHVKLVVRLTESISENLRLVQDRSSNVDAAFLFGGVANSKTSPDLLSLGRIHFAPIWFFYRGTETLDRLSQLRGKRIAIGPSLSRVIGPILAASGVTADTATILSINAPNSVAALKEGNVDVIYLPFAFDAPVIQALLRNPDIQLMSLTHLSRLVLPQGVVDLVRNIPDSDINLIALTNTVVARNDLHPEIIHLLAETLSEQHGSAGIFQRAGDFPTLTDPEFPMAEEALDYYRNGQTFFQRYLPFWMINHIKRLIAIFLAVFAVVIPLFTYVPKVYHWFLRASLEILYRHLRTIEADLEGELDASKIKALQIDLDGISRAARILPMRHSDLFIDLIMHIRQTHSELTSRLIALHD
jgi:TRAP-type uncharacterized transport system substrate-binding protein